MTILGPAPEYFLKFLDNQVLMMLFLHVSENNSLLGPRSPRGKDWNTKFDTLAAFKGRDPLIVCLHLMKNGCLDLHLKEENCLVDLVLIKIFQTSNVYQSLNKFRIGICITMIEFSWYSTFHNFKNTFHKEKVAVLEFILSLIMSEST